jgi:hypothetical protein
LTSDARPRNGRFRRSAAMAARFAAGSDLAGTSGADIARNCPIPVIARTQFNV